MGRPRVVELPMAPCQALNLMTKQPSPSRLPSCNTTPHYACAELPQGPHSTCPEFTPCHQHVTLADSTVSTPCAGGFRR